MIGVGNEFAGDDAAGLLVARALAGRGMFDIAETSGLMTDLVALFEGRGRVVIVDACVSGAAAGTVGWFDLSAGPLPPDLRTVSSHGLGVAEAVELARTLGLCPRECLLAVIEGARFALGEPPSAPVLEAVPGCADMVEAALCRAGPG